jgi:hypothetical protein
VRHHGAECPKRRIGLLFFQKFKSSVRFHIAATPLGDGVAESREANAGNRVAAAINC